MTLGTFHFSLPDSAVLNFRDPPQHNRLLSRLHPPRTLTPPFKNVQPSPLPPVIFDPRELPTVEHADYYFLRYFSNGKRLPETLMSLIRYVSQQQHEFALLLITQIFVKVSGSWILSLSSLFQIQPVP